MDEPAFSVETSPAAADLERLERGLGEPALPSVGTPGFRPLAVFAVLEDYPAGRERYFLRKALEEAREPT